MNARTALLIVALLTLLVEHHVYADFIWHDDEIPYEANAKCRRGRSYYTNSMHPNETDLNKDSSLESLLTYPGSDACIYCVCSTDGVDVGCISKSLWYCEYYRYLKHPFAAKQMYRTLFQQDRPVYFRQLSYRIRRTMDDGIYDLIKTVGNDVTGANKTHCIPFVSEYSDCSDANVCLGCSKCTCTAEGQWTCEEVSNCPGIEEAEPTEEDNLLDMAIQAIENDLKTKAKKQVAVKPPNNHPYVPGPTKFNDDVLLEAKRKMDENIYTIMARGKRSIKEPKAAKKNSTVQFYDTVDEINEDTLKNSNMSGTINIKKVEAAYKPLTSRRAAVTDNNSSLEISYKPELFDNHIIHNKLETNHSDNQFDAVRNEKFHEITGNISAQLKNKDLSKIVVNELKSGIEHIGDKHAPIISNITFKSENDTLTAMTFIAGNLLNKLWNMEKDSSGETFETEILKHEKIADLLELFREPLSLRQETFLKNALEHLSNAINNNKDVKNVTLCANIEEATRLLKKANTDNLDEVKSIEDDILKHASGIVNTENVKKNLQPGASDAVSKINNVLNLMRKFESLQKNLGDLKTIQKSDIQENEQIDSLTRDEDSVLSVYGNVLEKITKLIIPEKNSKKFSNKLRNVPLQEINRKLKDSFNNDIANNKMTSKDKLILEYIAHMASNPGCLLNNNHDKINVKSIPKVEGILLNLSEFFKIKSFVDLLKIVQPEKSNIRVSIDTTVNPVTTTTKAITESVTVATLDNKHNKLTSTKEKLKTHLKTIVEDLIEMQNVAGSISNGNEKNLADIFPCIYNILNGIGLNENKNLTEIEKVRSILESIKTEMNSPQTRRSNIVTEGRPKSVVVWERVVKNLDKKQKQKTRRSFNAKLPKSFEDLKKMIDSIESYGSNTYKNVAVFTEVPPTDKLVLLKTLDADTKRYINVLDNIILSINKITDLSSQQRKDIDEFVGNADRSIKLNEKVIKGLNKKKNNRGVDVMKQLKLKLKTKPSFKLPEASPSLNTYDTNNKDKSIARDEIIHQLIKNRMLTYIRMKEAKGDVTNDVNYDIAKKILAYLENGNFGVAREMYKLYHVNTPNDRFHAPTFANENYSPSVIKQKQPLIEFEDPNIVNAQMQPLTQDYLLKQLQSIKNMRI